MSVSDNKATGAGAPSSAVWTSVKQLGQVREVNVLVAMLFVGALISLYTPYFLTTNSLMGVFRAFSLTAIMCIGMVLVIITGGIDLSVGSAMGLASLITALGFDAGYSEAISIAAGIAVGVSLGLVNGLLITAIGLLPFIATLGTLSIGRGFIYMITHGVPVTPTTPDSFAVLGQGYVGRVPVPVVIMLVLMVIFALIMRRTPFWPPCLCHRWQRACSTAQRCGNPASQAGRPRGVLDHRIVGRDHRVLMLSFGGTCRDGTPR